MVSGIPAWESIWCNSSSPLQTTSFIALLSTQGPQCNSWGPKLCQF
nr:MAG TPA: hypothetical protein [Caudoviricetes sp.]